MSTRAVHGLGPVRDRLSGWRRSPRIAWAACGSAAALWLAAVLVQMRNVQTNPRYYYVDLQVYVGGVQSWFAGQDPYLEVYGPHDDLPFTYPPFALIALAPFGMASFQVAATALVATSLLAVTGVALITARSMQLRAGRPGLAQWTWALALGLTTAFFLLEPFGQTKALGQINALVMLIVVVDLLLPTGRWRGILLGVVVSVKLTPAVFLLYLVWRRDYASVVRTVVTVAVCWILAWVLGAGNILAYFTTPHGSSGMWSIGLADNQSLRGALIRATDSGGILIWVAAVCAALLLVALVLRSLDRRRDEALGLVAVATTGLLVSPLSWDHHWVWILPMMVTAVFVVRERSCYSVVALVGVVVAFPDGAFNSQTDQQVSSGAGFVSVIDVLASNAGALFGLLVLAALSIRTDRWWPGFSSPPSDRTAAMGSSGDRSVRVQSETTDS